MNARSEQISGAITILALVVVAGFVSISRPFDMERTSWAAYQSPLIGSAADAIHYEPDAAVQANRTVQPSLNVAPAVTLSEDERVESQDVMAFIRSVLVEDGESFARIRKSSVNLAMVRRDVNDFVTGYSLPVERFNDTYGFLEETKAWRATSIGKTSDWPPAAFPAARQETRLQAGGLEAIPVLTNAPRQLRLYYFPIRVGYDGHDYEIEHSLIVFFVHPQTGTRMTAMQCMGRTHVAVNEPLGSTVSLYIADTTKYSAVLGLAKAHVPTKFFAQSLQFDSGELSPEHPLSKCLEGLLSAYASGRKDENVDGLIEILQSHPDNFAER